MAQSFSLAACVDTGPPVPRRLNGAEATIVIVIIIMSGVLVLAGLQPVAVLQLLAGAGGVAVTTVLLSRGPLRAVLGVLRPLLIPAPQV